MKFEEKNIFGCEKNITLHNTSLAVPMVLGLCPQHHTTYKIKMAARGLKMAEGVDFWALLSTFLKRFSDLSNKEKIAE